MPLWLHFVPWHWLLWLSVPFVLLGAGWAFAAEETAALLKKMPVSAWICAGMIFVGAIYHVASVASACAEATAAADARWTAKLAAAAAAAKADHKALQDKVDAMAQPSNDVLHAQFTKLQATMDDMRLHPTLYAMPKPAKPLPADCKLDPAVVAAANEALQQ